MRGHQGRMAVMAATAEGRPHSDSHDHCRCRCWSRWCDRASPLDEPKNSWWIWTVGRERKFEEFVLFNEGEIEADVWKDKCVCILNFTAQLYFRSNGTCSY